MNKIVTFKKIDQSCPFWKNLLKRRNGNHDEVTSLVNTFQGCEGSDCTITDISNRKFPESRNSNNERTTLLITDPKKFPSNELETAGWKCIGYDYGIFEEDSIPYSSIFHEVLFGLVEELKSCQGMLNQNLLLPDIEAANRYRALHQALGKSGKDVEHDEFMSIYMIWNPNTDPHL